MDQEGPQVDRFFELSPDLLCIACFDGFFKRVNQAWGDILGFSPDELQDRPFPSASFAADYCHGGHALHGEGEKDEQRDGAAQR